MSAMRFTTVPACFRPRVELFGTTFPGHWSRFPLLTPAEEEDKVQTQWISGDGFRILGIQPALGRLLTAADDGQRRSAELQFLGPALWIESNGSRPLVRLSGEAVPDRGRDSERIRRAGAGLSDGFVVPQALEPRQDPRLGPGLGTIETRNCTRTGQTGPSGGVYELPARSYGRVHSRGWTARSTGKYKNAPLNLRSASDRHPSMVRMDFERPLWILAWW